MPTERIRPVKRKEVERQALPVTDRMVRRLENRAERHEGKRECREYREENWPAVVQRAD